MEINKYCGFADQVFATLCEAYQMKDWNMSYSQFLVKAHAEYMELLYNLLYEVKAQEMEEDN